MEINNMDFAAVLAGLTARVETLEKEVALLKGQSMTPSEGFGPVDLDLDVVPVFDEESTAAIEENAQEPASEPSITQEPIAAIKDEPLTDTVTETDVPTEATEVTEVSEAEPSEEVPTEMVAEEKASTEPAPVAVTEEPEAEPASVVEEPIAESTPEEEPEEDMPESFMDLFGGESGAVTAKPKRGRPTRDINEAEASKTTGKAIMDVMADRQAWYHDMPGAPVKSLRSAIGLGDQVLFIRRLFRADSALYQDTIERINGMTTLDAAVKYLTDTFPEWKMDSEDVYRFMMAVRRKIR